MTSIIIDDEATARIILQHLCDSIDDIDVIDSFSRTISLYISAIVLVIYFFFSKRTIKFVLC